MHLTFDQKSLHMFSPHMFSKGFLVRMCHLDDHAPAGYSLCTAAGCHDEARARATSRWPYLATDSVLKGLPAGALHHLFAVQCTQGAGTGYGDTGLLCCTVCFCLMSWTRLPAHWYKRGLSLVAWLFARSSLAAWLPLAEQISSVQ